MSKTMAFGKKDLVVQTIAARILDGDFAHGERLAGEYDLAREFAVSRGTVRLALTELQRQNLIATRGGMGSFVTFDGHRLDQRKGWAQAFSDAGSDVRTEVLEIAAVAVSDIPQLPDGVELTDAVAVRRLRTVPASAGRRAISFECASIPATGSLADLPRTGLVDGSLWATLRTEGLVASRGSQTVDIHPLTEREAALLGRAPGTAFLRSVRTSFADDGRFVEHVVSLLDPERFTLQLTFGKES
ncbi:MAG: GntR family transcriptional regulator [Cellulomonadaceae bacterium]